MKGTSSILGIVALVAVAVLYVLYFTGGSNAGNDIAKNRLLPHRVQNRLKLLL